MFRSSGSVIAYLVGAAALFGCCFTSCVNCDNEPERDAAGAIMHDSFGNVVYRRHCHYHPLGRSYGHGYTFWHSSPYSSSSYSSSVGTGTHSLSGTTSRGGFGSTGSHGAAGS